MIYWTAKATSECKYIDKVYIATDSDDIRRVVNELMIDKVEVIDRSEESASDTASTEFAMLEFAEKYGIGDDCVHVVEGRIDEEIPRLCEQLNARMVCMGTTPRSSFFGSIDSIASELVLEQIRGDVYIVSSAHIDRMEAKAENKES